MKKSILPILALMLLTACNNSSSDKKETSETEIQQIETNVTVENFLNTPEKINLNGTDFILSWSSHPLDNYYKQEYIPKNNTLEAYQEMISVEVFLGEVTGKDGAAQKIHEIEARKATDRVANYAVSEDETTDETILDFMLSEGTGEDTILEWNVYRYADYIDEAGNKGIALFSLSKRGYGVEVAQFGPDIRDNRTQYMKEFIALDRPSMSLK